MAASPILPFLERLSASIALLSLAVAVEGAELGDLQRKCAMAVTQGHDALEMLCEERDLHHRTRAKLRSVLEQLAGLRALCGLLARPQLPEAFEPSRLMLEVGKACDAAIEILRPVIDYYSRPELPSESADRARQTGRARSEPTNPADFEPDGEGGGYPVEMEYRYSRPKSGAPLTYLVNERRAQRAKIGPTDVAVYFGTTRTESSDVDARPEERFLNGRGAGALVLGRAVVSIPRGHRIGVLEQPLSIWKFRLASNPAKHVVLREITTLTEASWVESMSSELEACGTRAAFVFIHGFNVTFHQAMLRAAQIAHDIGYGGLVTAFSWGSEGSIDGYPADEDTVALAIPELVRFLSILRSKAQIEEFHVVAHSMGSRALLGALTETSWWGGSSTPIAEAVFAAPDVDATLYRQQMAVVQTHARRFTLYGSERDWALAVSRSIRKNHPRAGDGGQNIVVLGGVETVDATQVGEHLFGLGHSYIGDKRTILADLWAVLRGLAMPRFGLREQVHAQGKYWLINA